MQDNESTDTGAVQQMMTLCALAYVDEGQPLDTIKSMIETELAKPQYATAAKWDLVWGPIRTPQIESDNLLYVSRRRDSGTLAIVLRGTVFDSLRSWIEDVPTALVALPWADEDTDAQAQVSKEFLTAVETMTGDNDPATGLSLRDFLAQSGADRCVVTGHSQGGGLAPILQGWVHAALPELPCTSVTFAAPSSGNGAFAQAVARARNSTRIVNPLDIVPLAYADLPRIWKQGVPVKSLVSEEVIKLAVDLWEEETGLTPGDFAQPADHVVTLDARHDPRPDASYEARVAAQHHANSYLWLLDAPQTDVGGPSPLAPDGAGKP